MNARQSPVHRATTRIPAMHPIAAATAPRGAGLVAPRPDSFYCYFICPIPHPSHISTKGTPAKAFGTLPFAPRRAQVLSPNRRRIQPANRPAGSATRFLLAPSVRRLHLVTDRKCLLPARKVPPGRGKGVTIHEQMPLVRLPSRQKEGAPLLCRNLPYNSTRPCSFTSRRLSAIDAPSHGA